MSEMERPVLAVGAAAAANTRQREYPIDLMAGVLEQLLGEGPVGSVVLFGDAASRRRLTPLRQAVGKRGLDLCGELSVPGTAAAMKDCDAALMVDGGLLHVALCSDLPVVAIFGPTEVFPSDPRDGDQGYEAISSFDECRCRCLPHRGIRVRDECREHAQCMRTIPPERIVRAVASALSPRASTPDGRVNRA